MMHCGWREVCTDFRNVAPWEKATGDWAHEASRSGTSSPRMATWSAQGVQSCRWAGDGVPTTQWVPSRGPLPAGLLRRKPRWCDSEWDTASPLRHPDMVPAECATSRVLGRAGFVATEGRHMRESGSRPLLSALEGFMPWVGLLWFCGLSSPLSLSVALDSW